MAEEYLEGLSINQRRALNRGLAALDAMAAIWSAKVSLTKIAQAIAAKPEGERAKVIAAMVRQGFVEGAYEHFLDHKDRRWIPVSERLPKPFVDVPLIAWSSKAKGFGHVTDDGLWVDATNVEEPEPYIDDVTYWFELPELPSQPTGKNDAD